MDAVEVIADGIGSVSSYSDNNIVHTDSSSSATQAPLTPQRSAQNSATNSPNSTQRVPNITVIDTNHVPIPSRMPPSDTSNFVAPRVEYRGDNGVLWDVQRLEMQQAAQSQRRTQTSPHSNPATDDEQTEPSTTTGQPEGYTRSDGAVTSTFGKLIQNTRRRIASRDKKQTSSGSDEEEEDIPKGVLIYGYLQKLGRNGKWQTRWFESDGECLTYYKSSQRLKVLATLDLAKVGSIVLNHETPGGVCFTINISERPYHLRADSKAACNDWVITLNRVKEARMHEGNVKLLLPDMNQPPDLLDDAATPRVVAVANRNRTRALDDEDIHSWEAWPKPANEGKEYNAAPTSSRLARWQKPRTSISHIASKLAKWARSIRRMSCADAEQHVVLDHHVHPPGHDDKPKRVAATSPASHDPSKIEWIGIDASPSDRGGAPISGIDSDSVGHSIDPNTEEEETRELS